MVCNNDPDALSRSDARRTAAALTWLTLRSNNALGRKKRLQVDELWHMFGVSNCAARGWALLSAAGLPDPNAERLFGDPPRRVVWLSDSNLLDSTVRARLVCERNGLVGAALDQIRKHDEQRPIRNVGNGQVHIRARPITPRWALTAVAETGRATVMVTVGESDDDVEVLALSIPDARRLVSMIGTALDAPFPQAVQRSRSRRAFSRTTWRRASGRSDRRVVRR